jgi:hypothetical protein
MKTKAKDWFLNLSKAKKTVVVFLAGLTVGTFALAAAPTNSQQNTTQQNTPSQVQGVENEIVEQKPVFETKTVTETQPIPFAKTTVNDATMLQGQTALRTAGVNGVKTLSFTVEYEDGQEVGREPAGEVVTMQPVNEVTAIGTKVVAVPKPAPAPAPAPKPAVGCSPHYTGCVPIASDVDCAGGSGNGPAYVAGPIQVVGSDIYDLDRDGNGIACE